MKNKKSVPTKEEIDEYMSQLKSSVGDINKIEQALENQRMFVAYLAQIGVKSSWLERAAIVEITKQKLANILLKSKHINISKKGIKYGKNEMSVREGIFYIYYNDSDNEFIKFEEASVAENTSKKR